MATQTCEGCTKQQSFTPGRASHRSCQRRQEPVTRIRCFGLPEPQPGITGSFASSASKGALRLEVSEVRLSSTAHRQEERHDADTGHVVHR